VDNHGGPLRGGPASPEASASYDTHPATAYTDSDIQQLLTERNGKSYEHTNQIEASTFYDFHIHMATERYQELEMREDAYAEATDRFGDFDSAFRCLVDDCGFETLPDPNLHLFDEEGA
jgi:hypothetical protein